MRRKEERSKQGQTNNKAKQHSTPKAVTFPKKNELPHVHVCLTLLASFFLSSFSSLIKNMYPVCMYMYIQTIKLFGAV